jgi:hypothetical protein
MCPRNDDDPFGVQFDSDAVGNLETHESGTAEQEVSAALHLDAPSENVTP